MKVISKIGFGGGCHWCTEAVFQSLKGVGKVEQGFIAPAANKNSFSEAVVVHFDPSQIRLKDLVAIHLYTHNSTSEHAMRNKYRSAVYAFDKGTFKNAKAILDDLQHDFEQELVTKTHFFGAFKPSEGQFHNYYYSNPEKPFCKRYISPKLTMLMRRFSNLMERDSANTNHGAI